MAPKSYETTSKESTPSNTIRKTWDAYKDKNWSGSKISTNYTKLNGSGYTNQHTTEDCSVFACHEDGSVSSIKVPIGGWAQTYDGECGSGKLIDSVVYGTSSRLPKQLNEDTATNCAGGSSYGSGSYPTRDSTYFKSSDSIQKTRSCYHGIYASKDHDEENCLIGGVQWPVFCQMGDYAGTVPQCKTQCGNKTSTSGDDYCNWSLDRLCGKTEGDYVKKNQYNTKVKSDRNWIVDPVCKSYCGSSSKNGSPVCQTHKKNYCKRKDSWPDAAEYCYDYWKENKDASNMSNACKNKLTTASSPENITQNDGCGYLCRGGALDVDKDWCNGRRQEYCTANHNNMGTQYCLNFCKDNPDLCESYLQENFCKNKGDKMDNDVPGDTGKKYSDWCGCMMGTQFYQDYRDSVFKQFQDAGYNVEGISHVRTEPECMFPKCKGGSVLTSDQRDNIKDCGSSCVQIMLNTFDNTNIGGNYFPQQSANCSNIVKEEIVDDEPPATTNPPTSSSASEINTSIATSFGLCKDDCTVQNVYDGNVILSFIIVLLLAVLGGIVYGIYKLFKD